MKVAVPMQLLPKALPAFNYPLCGECPERQRPADQQSAVAAPKGAVDGATAAAIAAEGELKATIRTFQGDNRSAVYRYY